jgi:hypothetical protein
VDFKKIATEVGQGLVGRVVEYAIVVCGTLMLPYYTAVSEHWSWPLAVSLGIVLFAALIFITKSARAWLLGDAQNIETALRLQFNAPPNLPVMLDQKNVWRWYGLTTIFQMTGANGQIEHVPQTIVFVVFDKPVSYRQLRIDSGGAMLPIHEVKDSGVRHAIIAFHGPLNGMVLRFYVDLATP